MPEIQYPKKSKYESEYKAADKYLMVNDNDQWMHPVVLRLPDPPDIRLIDGYGLPPEEQKYGRYMVEPPRIQILWDNCINAAKLRYEGRVISYYAQKNFWQTLNDEQESYQEEISYIKKTQWFLRYGYWCFIFGKPYWIPPTHFFYTKFYYANAVKGNRVDYRDEDRLVKVWEWYGDNTCEAFKMVDEKGAAVRNEDGVFEMVDVGHRTSLGSANPKRRRKGITMSNCSDALYYLITDREQHTVIQADVGKSAGDVYEDNFLPAWKNLRPYLLPINDGSSDPTDGVYLRPPSSIIGERYLNGYCIWNDSSKEGTNDRRKIHFLLSDEEGKASLYDVDKRWRIDKYTLMQGTDVHGRSRHPSTVEELGAGGDAFRKMVIESDFYTRDLVGMTKSNLFRIFRPVEYGWDGFIDEWGFSVVDSPTEAQLKNPPPRSQYHVLGMGSREFWDKKYQEMLNDPTQHGNYRVELRKHPRKLADCFIGGSGDMGFNYITIDQRLADLRIKPETIRGNFKRHGDKVEWTACEDGRFVVSNLFLGQQNQWTYGDDVWDEKKQAFVPAKRPLNTTRFVGGCDPFDYGNSNPTKKQTFHLSKGGGAIYHMTDPNESHLNIQDQESGQIVCYYENKPPSLEEYCADMLAMALWYGALINVETNKKRVIEYFVDENFGGFLWHASMPDGTIRKEPGTYNTAGTKNDMLNSVRDFLQYRAHKCSIKEFLEQAREMRDPSQLRVLDGFCAAGWAIYASKGTYGMAVERVTGGEGMDLSDWYEGEREY